MTSHHSRRQYDPDTLHSLISTAVGKIEEYQPSVFTVTGKLVSLPPKGQALVIGDLHGDLTSLKTILKEANFESGRPPNGPYYAIFLGDYIDRGYQQIEVMATVLNLLNNLPDRVILLRGNHEGPSDIEVSPHDFPLWLERLYGEEGSKLYLSFRELFDHLYTAVIVQGKALLLHGGIPTEAEGLLDIAYAHQKHPEQSHLTEILWNDPSDFPGVTSSSRGIGNMFGIDITSSFLDKIGVDMLIRGHQPCDQGYSYHDGRILTLFSCKLPHYRNSHAAYLLTPLNEPFDRRTLGTHIHKI